MQLADGAWCPVRACWITSRAEASLAAGKNRGTVTAHKLCSRAMKDWVS